MLLAQRLHHFMVPAPNRARASNFSTFSQTSVILFPFFFFFALSHPSGCETVSPLVWFASPND